MAKNNHFEIFEDKEKAIHHCLWQNFKNRINEIQFCVLSHPENQWAVCPASIVEEMEIPPEVIPENYISMTYDDIRQIRMDINPSSHLEEIIGMFSVVDGDILRFILASKIPLEKLIRYELAIRGHDENHVWCGFEKAEAIWLK